MEWWIWALFGLALLFIEAITPGGFYAIFFAASAFLIALLVSIDLGGSLTLQWLLFSLLSIVSLLVFRNRLLAVLGGSRQTADTVDTLVGEMALLGEDLLPGAVGRAELHGSTWNVQNGDTQQLAKGQRCRVQRVDGLMLIVRAA
jgi:membrane protein implicated in regulation of membrane protease activity